MESDETEQSFDISIADLQNTEKIEKTKKSNKEYAREYVNRTEVKDRLNAKRQAEAVNKRLKEMDQDHHTVCKKLGKPMGHARTNPAYFYRCRPCEISYSEKEKSHFFKGNKCPCCHLMLRTRKTVIQKRKEH